MVIWSLYCWFAGISVMAFILGITCLENIFIIVYFKLEKYLNSEYKDIYPLDHDNDL